MKLLDVIRIARRTKLKNISEMDVTDEVFVDYLNLAVLDLYKRFTFKTEEAIITLREIKTQYKLDGTDDDVSLPTNDEVLQITSAYDEKGRLGINDDIDVFGIYLLDYQTVQVPLVTNGDNIGLLYKPYPKDVVYSTDVDGVTEDDNIELPKGTLDCVVNYIAYVANDSIELGTGDVYLQKYEMACAKLLEDGVIQQESFNIDVTKRGYA